MRRRKMEINIKELRRRLLEEVEKAIDRVLEDLNKPKVRYKAIKEFVDLNGKKYKAVIIPTKQLDKIAVYLYKAGKKLDIVGEVVDKDGYLQFYPYLNKLKKLAYKEKFDIDSMVSSISDVVNKYIDRIKEFVDRGAKIRSSDEVVRKEDKEESHYEELPEDIAYRIRMIQEEMKQYLEKTGEEYVPESVLNKLLKKYKVDKAHFIRFVTEFYEKEKGKWYPV